MQGIPDMRAWLAAGALLCGLAAAVWAQTGSMTDEYGAGSMEAPGSGTDDLPLQSLKPETETEVRALLESQGYSDIRNIQHDGEVITADAVRDGEPQYVVIRLKTESQDGG